MTLQNGRADIGGAIRTSGYAVSSLDLVELDNVVIQDSAAVAGPGGAISVPFCNLTIKNSLLQHNSASESGGAIAILTVSHNTIIEDSIVRQNTSLIGGGIGGSGGALTMTRTLIENNTSSNSGGGLAYGNGYFTLSDSTIRNSVATDGNGGGIRLVDVYDALIEGSTINGNNTEKGSGGGIYFLSNYEDPLFQMTNSTISGNTAFLGGGLFLNPTGDSATNIRDTTIANNTALSVVGAGGAIFLDPDSNPVSLTRSIISGNNGSPACYPIGSLNSTGLSLLQDNSCGSHPTDVVGVNPLLGPLANNGGPTQTHALQTNSPAIDLANCVPGIVVDQRGVMRPQGERCDSGAFEFGDLGTAVYLTLVVRTP